MNDYDDDDHGLLMPPPTTTMPQAVVYSVGQTQRNVFRFMLWLPLVLTFALGGAMVMATVAFLAVAYLFRG